MYEKLPLFILLAAFGGMPPAAAETVYRCGDSYSQQPCPGGQPVQVDDPRSAGQSSDTRQASQRDAKTADAMEKARLKEEAQPAQVSLPPPKPQDAAQDQGKDAASAKAKKPALFTAVAPKKPGEPAAKKKKKKAKKKAA